MPRKASKKPPAKRKPGRPKGSKAKPKATPRAKTPTRRQQILELLNISHQTLHRYRQKPDYPGDDADNETLTKWYEGNKSGRGRPARPKTPADKKAIDEMSNLRADKLRAETEKIEIATGKHLEKVMEVYRDKVTKTLNVGLDIIFREIRRLDLDPSQLKRIDEAAKDAAERIKREMQ